MLQKNLNSFFFFRNFGIDSLLVVKHQTYTFINSMNRSNSLIIEEKSLVLRECNSEFLTLASLQKPIYFFK